jgi:hypothetical protein
MEQSKLDINKIRNGAMNKKTLLDSALKGVPYPDAREKALSESTY